ncbi:hypothetical protein BDV93DRAFT_522525 [Ceratobasidium sp. AG-I]|nr:hypothetical protein BDV93DRAFT_522525 [Ceratobasidium sp. AG-I]
MSPPTRSRFWEIPELVKHLSSFLACDDCARLARSSRLCFDSAIGLVWHEVRGVGRILDLLPGGVFVARAEEHDQTGLTPLGVTTSELSRFHFYAQLVKRLEIPEPDARLHRANTWANLIAYASQSPLLPNLEHLAIVRDQPPAQSYLFRWITMFLSPNLKSIKTCSKQSGSWLGDIDPAGASELTNQIVQRCPLLEDLVLPRCRDQLRYAGNSIHYSKIDDNALSYKYLARARHLSTLTTDLTVLRSDALQSLGTLLQLTTLNILRGKNIVQIPRCDLAPELFPALTHVSLSTNEFRDVGLLFSIKTMAQRLKSIYLELCPVNTPPGENFNVPSIFSTIAHASPHVDNLTVCRKESNPFGSAHLVLPMSSLSVFSLRPICRLSLSGLIFLGSTVELCQTLARSLPLLQRLRLPNQLVNIWELSCFSVLHELEFLAVDLEWASDQGTGGENDVSQPSPTLRILESNPPPIYIRFQPLMLLVFSQFILEIAPNFQSLIPPPNEPTGAGYLELNDKIKELRGTKTQTFPVSR